MVRVTIGKSQGLYTSLSRKTKAKNSALITIGDVHVDIPQHPVILHDMMTRSSKQLSSTLMVSIRHLYMNLYTHTHETPNIVLFC